MMRAVSTRILSTVAALSVGLPLPLAYAGEPPAEALDEAADDASADSTDGDAGSAEDASDTADAPAEAGAEEADGSEAAEGEQQAQDVPAEQEADPADEDTSSEDEGGDEEGAADEDSMDEGVSAEGPMDDRGPPPSFGDKAATGKGLIIAGGATIGLGLAFLATSVAITRCDPDSPDCRFGDQDEFLIPTAATGTAVGVLLLTAGLINRSRYKKWERGDLKSASFAPTYLPGGGVGVGAVGRF